MISRQWLEFGDGGLIANILEIRFDALSNLNILRCAVDVVSPHPVVRFKC